MIHIMCIIENSQMTGRFSSWTMIIKCGLKIDLIMSEHHDVKFILLWTSSIVRLIDFLTYDK